MMKKLLITILLFGLAFLNLSADENQVLKIHCGTTMVKPIKEMAKVFESKYNCRVKLVKGGSQDLFDSLKFLKNIDLYLPGSSAYLKKHKADNFFISSKYIGFNQAVIFVQKSNPKSINSLEDFENKDIKTMLCNPDSGSIGKNSKNVLTSYKGEEFYDKIYSSTTLLGSDSKTINKKLREKSVDMAINWRATAFFDDNSKYIDIVDIDKQYAPKKKLMLTLLSFSPEPILAQEFMNFASSKEGQSIMKKYGFL